MRPYVIRQGDHLMQLAHRKGFSAEAVWNHAANEPLQHRRMNPDILNPGDILHIPDAREGWNPLPLTIGGENSFIAKIPAVEVKLALERSDGTPVSGKRFRVDGLGPQVFEGTTDDTGLAVFSVPVHIQEVEVSVDEEDLYYRIYIGHMDPADEPSGASKRLANLGYLAPLSFSKMELSDSTLRQAVAAFQAAQELNATGILDDTTRDALVRAHGS